MNYLSDKNYNDAYIYLRKSQRKFKIENKIESLIEATFFLSSVLAQLEKNSSAQNSYEFLEELASELHHQKYYEISLFMGGVCALKNKNFLIAFKKFSKLENMEINYLDIFNYNFQ